MEHRFLRSRLGGSGAGRTGDVDTTVDAARLEARATMAE
jgi:hypothetical protein